MNYLKKQQILHGLPVCVYVQKHVCKANLRL